MGENEMRNTNAQDMNHILKARYDKLKELQEAQTDPFVITTAKQTHHSEEIKSHFSDLENKESRLPSCTRSRWKDPGLCESGKSRRRGIQGL